MKGWDRQSPPLVSLKYAGANGSQVQPFEAPCVTGGEVTMAEQLGTIPVGTACAGRRAGELKSGSRRGSEALVLASRYRRIMIMHR